MSGEAPMEVASAPRSASPTPSKSHGRRVAHEGSVDDGGPRRMSFVMEGGQNSERRPSVTMADASPGSSPSGECAPGTRTSAEWGDASRLVNFFQHQTESLSHLIAPIEERPGGERRDSQSSADSAPSPSPPIAGSLVDLRTTPRIRAKPEPQEWHGGNLATSPPAGYANMPLGFKGGAYYTWHLSAPEPYDPRGGDPAAAGVQRPRTTSESSAEEPGIRPPGGMTGVGSYPPRPYEGYGAHPMDPSRQFYSYAPVWGVVGHDESGAPLHAPVRWPESSSYFPAPPSMDFPLRKTSSEPNMLGKPGHGHSSQTHAHGHTHRGASKQLKTMSGRDAHEPYARTRPRQVSAAAADLMPVGFPGGLGLAVSQPTTPRSAPTTPRYGQMRPLDDPHFRHGHGDDAALWTSPSLPNLSTSPGNSMGVLSAGPEQTGIVYDSVVLLHKCPCPNASEVHGESPERLQSAYTYLNDRGVLQRCHRVKARKATLKELYAIHSEAHTVTYGTPTQHQNATKFAEKRPSGAKAVAGAPPLTRLPCGGKGIATGLDAQTYWSEDHSALAVRTAAGSVVELATKVARGELRNGLALVRPPGHHAERGRAIGGCYVNNVAVAAKALRKSAGVNRVMVVDWDLFHGNGTQEAFYKDPSVLFVSLHRSDGASVFPFTGRISETGLGGGEGYTVNIPWSTGADAVVGDAEYLAAFRAVVMPLARQFSPEIVLVSAGFGAADGPALGGYTVTPEAFAHMTRMLMRACEGRVVLALEGGRNTAVLNRCLELCLNTLLGDPVPELPASSAARRPTEDAVKVLTEVVSTHRRHWPILSTAVDMVSRSPAEAAERERTEEADTMAATEALAALAMNMPPTAALPSPVSLPQQPMPAGPYAPLHPGVGFATQHYEAQQAELARAYASAMSAGVAMALPQGAKGVSRAPRLTVRLPNGGAGEPVAQGNAGMQSLAVAASLVDASRE